jgi:hypothetical protein
VERLGADILKIEEQVIIHNLLNLASNKNKNSSSDSVTRFFASRFFHESVSPQSQSIPLKPFQIFSKIRGDICNSRCSTSINESMTPAASFSTSFASIVNTSGKFVTGVNDTDGKFATGVNDAGGKLLPVSKTPAANLPPVSFTPVANNGSNYQTADNLK